MAGRLDGKVALISGASRGMGEAHARTFVKTVIPALREAGGGAIVNISSVAGMFGVPGVVSYASSKYAVRGMTKVAALELGADGIRVNSVHPGSVDTPMVAPDAVGGVQATGQGIDQPLPRVARPEEISRLVLFLASDESSFCTGSEFVVDGGITAGQMFRGLME